MLTNYLSVIRLNEKLLPLLKTTRSSYRKRVIDRLLFQEVWLLTGQQAALHSYTQSLRIALENSSIKVFELMPH
jgi:uncharacterized oxidoreductase